MTDSLHEFVAEELWLAIAVVTVPVVALAGVAGFETLAGVLSIVGFVLLVPIFLFWGEELADVLVGDREEADADRTATDEGAADAIETLKRRYAAGELSDEAFERRVERLLALDDVDASRADTSALYATLESAADDPPTSGERSDEPRSRDAVDAETGGASETDADVERYR